MLLQVRDSLNRLQDRKMLLVLEEGGAMIQQNFQENLISTSSIMVGEELHSQLGI